MNPNPLSRQLQCDLNGDFAAAFCKLRRAAIVFARVARRDPVTRLYGASRLEFRRLGCAAADFGRSVAEWDRWCEAAPAGPGFVLDLDWLTVREGHLAWAAAEYVEALSEAAGVCECCLQSAARAELRKRLDDGAQRLVEAAAAVGRECRRDVRRGRGGR